MLNLSEGYRSLLSVRVWFDESGDHHLHSQFTNVLKMSVCLMFVMS